MFARVLGVTCVALLLAGCSSAVETPVETASAAEALQVAAPGALPGPQGELVLPITLDGSTGTQAYVCATPAPSCIYREVIGGKSDLLLEGVVGEIVGGTLALEWTATSPLTQDLAFGVMLMGGEGGACEPVSLGLLRGSSPLEIDVAASERPVCDGEILHVWASNGIYVGDPPAYVQLDVDQAFHLEGTLRLAPIASGAGQAS